MSESNNASQQNLIYVLAAVVVVLVLVVGILVTKKSTDANIPAVSPTSSQPPAGMGTQQPAQQVPFDPKTATKVTKGQTPEQWTKAYYEACEANKYAEAYKMLPADKQASYGDAASFEQQLKGYGITGYSLDKMSVSSDGKEAKIVGWQKTSMGEFGYEWVYVLEGGQWLVKSRNQSGMK